MLNKKTLLAVLLLAAGSSVAEAKNIVVFVHGRNGSPNNTCVNTTNSDRSGDNGGSYWNWSGNNWAMNIINWIPQNWGPREARFVNYNGQLDPKSWGSCRAQSMLQAALDECRWGKGNSCYIVCHSAGCLATEYHLANYGWGSYDVRGVVETGSAANGSYLADAGYALITGAYVVAGTEMDRQLAHVTTRGAFDHWKTGGYTHLNVTGYGGPGWMGPLFAFNGHDGAVAMDDACNQSSQGAGRTKCQDASRFTNHIYYEPYAGNSDGGRQAFNRDHGGVLGSGYDVYRRCAFYYFCN